MIKMSIKNRTLIKINNSVQGETIEQKIERIVSNKEPITDGAPLIYTDRKDGVQPDYDIRTDRWDAAITAMDKVTKSKLAKRAEYLKERDEKGEPKPDAKADAGTAGNADAGTK